MERDLAKQPLSEAELQEIFAARDPREFLNTRSELYRKMKMKENPPTRAEALQLMAREPNLIRRPLVVRGSQAVAGYDEMGLLRLLR